MKFEEIYRELSEEAKQKLAECKTQEELRGVLAEAGVDPLNDALLDAVAGGLPYLQPKEVHCLFR